MTPCKILIIDDDRDDVEILADAFQKSGVDSVHCVFSAMEAFIYLQTLTDSDDLPRLIVTDMYLPGITGAEFLTDLKKWNPTRTYTSLCYHPPNRSVK